MNKKLKKFFSHSRNTRGFTLVELLVVIIILGILATSAVIVFSGYQKRARNSIRLSDLEELRGATERYKTDRDDTFAPNDSDFDNFRDALVPTYMQKLAIDPGNKSYQYARASGNYSFYFYGGYDEVNSTPLEDAFLKKGPSSEPVELNGVDGDVATTPTRGLEFGL